MGQCKKDATPGRKSIALAMELRLSCINPWICDSEQGKSEGFDSCDRPSNRAKILSKSSIFQPVWPWNLMDDLEK